MVGFYPTGERAAYLQRHKPGGSPGAQLLGSPDQTYLSLGLGPKSLLIPTHSCAHPAVATGPHVPTQCPTFQHSPVGQVTWWHVEGTMWLISLAFLSFSTELGHNWNGHGHHHPNSRASSPRLQTLHSLQKGKGLLANNS